MSRHSQAHVFHDWRWRDLLSGTFGFEMHYLVAEDRHGIAGVLPLAVVDSLLFGRSIVSLPFCSWAGPLARTPTAEKALVEAAVRLAHSRDIGDIRIRSVRPILPTWRREETYVTFRKPISSDHVENLAAVPRKQRAMIRKGIANKLRAGEGNVCGFYDLYTDMVHRLGTPPVPADYFRRVRHAFGDACEIRMVTTSDGTPVSAVLSLYWRDEVFPFYAGDRPGARRLAAADFKYWDLMSRAADLGYTAFNFGRSKRGSGSYRFKQHWGFQPQPLHYLSFPEGAGRFGDLNPTNPRFDLAIRMWRRSPRWFVNWLGPRIVRGLG